MLPLLEATRSYAQPRAFPTRCVIVVQTNGTIAAEFFPRGTGSELAGMTFPRITSALAPYRSDLIFLEKLELKNFTEAPIGGAHENFSVCFNGARGEPRDHASKNLVTNTPTIDQHIAERVAQQKMWPVRCLSLGVQVDRSGSHEGQRRCFYRGRDQAVTPDDDPIRVADRIFAGVQTGAAPSGDLDRLRAERRSMLDHVGRDLVEFARRMGTEDRVKIEAHLTSIRSLEQQLGNLTGATCGRPEPRPVALNDWSKHPDIMNAQMDLLVAALKCGLTRVATLQLNNANGANLVFSWLGITGKGRSFPQRDSHDIAHSGGEDKIRIEEWYGTQIASLIKRLKDTPEGNGTMLDNTVVLWANHMGHGGGHTSTNLPWVLAGKGGGYFKTGQFIRNAASVPVNGVFVALANAMGVPTTTFGDPKWGGELTALRAG
jgi:hypothetical protein